MPGGEPSFEWREFETADGLALRYRDYLGAQNRPPVICLHGLTRNSRDFAQLAGHLAGDRRVLVPDMRGRGRSDYSAHSATYTVPTYVADVAALRAHAGIGRYVAIGTSMGGLMTMMQAAMDPEPIAAAILNDIGPVIEPAGLARIREYVGQARNYPTWVHAAQALAEVHGRSHPGYSLEDWLGMAKRTMTVCQNGRIAFDYDMKLAEPILSADDNAAAAPPDLWAGFDALSDTPLLLVRGEQSDLLSEETFAEMARRSPRAQTLTVRDTGHAPSLDEPEVVSAITAFLAHI